MTVKWMLVTAAGVVGCIVVAAKGWPEIAFVPPGALAAFGIMAMIVLHGEDDT